MIKLWLAVHPQIIVIDPFDSRTQLMDSAPRQ
jgi:hypothetical protein